jgi:hypothetical protein
MPALASDLFWFMHYATNEVRAIVAEKVPGAFTLHGSAGAEDYVWWRNNAGTPEQYDKWTANFGRTVDVGGEALASHVPEPASGLLLLACATIMFAMSRGKVRCQI